jgi:hypothetical protein
MTSSIRKSEAHAERLYSSWLFCHDLLNKVLEAGDPQMHKQPLKRKNERAA